MGWVLVSAALGASLGFVYMTVQTNLFTGSGTSKMKLEAAFQSGSQTPEKIPGETPTPIARPADAFAPGTAKITTIKPGWTETLVATQQVTKLVRLKVQQGTLKGECQMGLVLTEAAPRMILLVLPGYTPPGDPYLQAPQQVIHRMQLMSWAARLKALVVVPQMNQSIYERQLYPTQQVHWASGGTIPSLQWLAEFVIPYVRQRFVNGRSLPVVAMGISTGAQGALKLGMFYPGLLTGAIGLSGTYDIVHLPTQDGEYPLHQAILGARSRYITQWQQEDILSQRAKLQFPLAVYSETNSSLTPQTRLLLTQVTQATGTASLIPGSAHNWDFWGHQVLQDEIVRQIEGWFKP